MKESVHLNGFTNESPVILWLWEVLEEYTETQKATFHFFVTGFLHFYF